MWRGMQKGKAVKAGTKGKLASTAAKRAAASGPVGIPTTPELDALIAKLQEMEDARKDGVVTLPGGETLEVTNLRKVFWPADGYTKGDLLRFYARVSPWLLPVVAERPLVMKRFPNGVNGKAFYQQKAPDVVPPGIRVEDTVDDEGADTITRRIVGGDLKTLLYMAQLGTISQDPWFSQYDTPHDADYVALDLDPMPGVPFAQVLDVARWVRDELERLGVPGVPKTSGSSGLHVYIPLPEGTSYEAGRLLCEIVATIVAHKHRKEATVERTVGKRGRTVYVDYLQNILGKTLATAYSRPRQRVRRRLDAADVGRSGRGRQPRRLHHQDRARALRRDARPVAAGHRRPAGRSARRPRADGARSQPLTGSRRRDQQPERPFAGARRRRGTSRRRPERVGRIVEAEHGEALGHGPALAVLAREDRLHAVGAARQLLPGELVGGRRVAPSSCTSEAGVVVGGLDDDPQLAVARIARRADGGADVAAREDDRRPHRERDRRVGAG